MLMNHKPQRLNGFIRYTVRYVTGEALTPVKPIWLDVRNCTGGLDPVFDVPGGGKRFSTFTRTADFTMPESGRLVSGGGHLHGGGVRLELRNATCGTKLLRVAPDLGRPEAEAAAARARADEDVLVPLDRRDPGRERADAPARCGLRQLRRRTRARWGSCSSSSRPEPSAAAARRRRSTIDLGQPTRRRRLLDAAATRAEGAGLDERRRRSSATSSTGANASRSKRGTTFTWRFLGQFQHDVTVVGGPEGFSAPWSLTGVFTHRFTKAGTYRLFCSLHPAKMVQQITVR